MNSKDSAYETQSVRISQDLKHHNWLLNKIKLRQDISFRTKKPSIPVSLDLNRLPRNTALNTKKTMQQNNPDPMKNHNMSISSSPYGKVNDNTFTTQQIPPQPPDAQRISKHILPVQLLPNPGRYIKQKPNPNNINKEIKKQNSGVMKNTVGTQTDKLCILSDEEYACYIKLQEDAQCNLAITENNNTQTSSNDLSPNVKHVVIDENSMINIINKSQEYKKKFLDISAILQNILSITSFQFKEDNIASRLVKKRKLLKSIEDLVLLVLSEEDKTIESPENLESVLNNAITNDNIMPVSENSDQEQQRRQITQTLLQKSHAVHPESNNIANYLQVPSSVNSSNMNASNAVAPRDPRLYRMADGSYIRKQQNQQSNARNNNISSQMMQLRNSGRSRPYPNNPAEVEPFQHREMQHRTQGVQMHQSQYVPYNQFQERQAMEVYYQNRNPNHYPYPNPPMQQNRMYNQNMYF